MLVASQLAGMILNLKELRIRAAEEVAQEFPSSKQARELIRQIEEFNIRLSVDLKAMTLEDHLRYKAMYTRLSLFNLRRGDDIRGSNDWVFESVIFLDIDEGNLHGSPSEFGA